MDRPTLVTGIRVLDLMCPFRFGGTLAIWGDEGTGVNVLAMETMRNLCRRYGATATVQFASSGQFIETHVREWVEKLRVGAWVTDLVSGARGEIRIHSGESNVAQLLPFASGRGSADAWAVLRRSVLKAGRLPAVDLSESSSTIAEADPKDTAKRIKIGVASGNQALVKFLSQPFFIAEPWTGIGGEVTERSEALAQVETLLLSMREDDY